MTAIATLTVNPSVDISTTAERVIADEKLRCAQPQVDPGGGGLNVSRVVAELGESSRAIYTRGGIPGDRLHALLDQPGIERAPIDVAGDTRENLTVTSEADGDQYRFVLPGPELTEREWQRCLEVVGDLRPSPRFMVASGSLPPGAPADLFAQVARTLAERGTQVIVDTSGESLRAVAAEGVYLLKPNVRELEQLAGGVDGSFEATADELVRQGAAEVLVLSLGSAGVYVTAADVPGQHVRAPTVPIRSRVGAGDSTVGGIVTALARGWDLLSAVRFGVAAGSAAVTTPGTQLCRRSDVEELFARSQGHPHVEHARDEA